MGCVITGVILHDPAHNRCVRGDLFAIGDDTWVVNAIVRGPDTCWFYGSPPDPEDRVLAIHENARDYEDIFERRGVFVICKDAATLNSVACEYLREGRVTL